MDKMDRATEIRLIKAVYAPAPTCGAEELITDAVRHAGLGCHKCALAVAESVGAVYRRPMLVKGPEVGPELLMPRLSVGGRAIEAAVLEKLKVDLRTKEGRALKANGLAPAGRRSRTRRTRTRK